MSVRCGLDIIENDLILLLDSNASRSYPGSGNTWYDLSTKANHAVSTNLVSENDTYGKVISLNSSSAITSVFSSLLNKYSFTLSFWGRPTATPDSNYQPITRLSHSSSGTSYFIFDTREPATPLVYCYVKDFATNIWDTRAYINTASYNTFSWNYYTLVMLAENEWKSYLNGNRIGTNTTPNQDLSGYGNITQLILGGSSCNFNLSQVSMYSRPLTDYEVRQNFIAHRSRYSL